ncbi:MAG: chemotaxis protein CheA, partial [Erysipelotrichia bacterium]|nr:chemotaxis protein CheA [Erysipelotrichia bacterium]
PVSQPKAAAHSAEDLLAGISVNEYEQQLLIEAQNQGTHIFMVMVTLVNDCLLKAPRAFMVNRALEELNCEIIKSVPDIKDLEDEKFDLSFKKLVFSQAEEAAVREAVESISEVDSVSIVRLTPDDFRTTQQDQAPQPVAEQPPPAKRRAPVAVPQQPIHADEKHADAATAKAPPTAERHSTQTVRVDMRRLDELMNLVGELVINRTRLADIGTAHKLKDLNEALTRVSHISSSLQNVVMQVRMVPIEQVFDRFPRMVRDLSKKLNKKINLVLEGKDTEMDRTVIDEIGDPMVHLIRNAIDHGIESPEERLAKGKSEVGTITLVARHEGNNVLIEVRDDGKGVDPTIIGRLAVERGIYTPEQMAKMPPEEIIRTIFLPGFSTAKEVSDLSGRGVGMDAVKGKLEDLNGVLELESKVGEGSRVIIKLPLTLAILPALMVRVGAEMFAIPLGSLLETMDINKSDINIVQHQEVTLLRGDVLPIIRLRNVLNVPTSEEEQKYIAAKEDEISIVVCSAGEKRAGFMVDELLGQQEIVIKSLGNLLGGLPGIMGATMRGDGSIALILDIPSFFQKGQTIQS